MQEEGLDAHLQIHSSTLILLPQTHCYRIEDIDLPGDLHKISAHQTHCCPLHYDHLPQDQMPVSTHPCKIAILIPKYSPPHLGEYVANPDYRPGYQERDIDLES